MDNEANLPEVTEAQAITSNPEGSMTRSDTDLVCGNCRKVFHFIEHFVEHRSGGRCVLVSTQCNTKPNVLAFLLWKETQHDYAGNWQLYQAWVNMDTQIREAWLVASQRNQSTETTNKSLLPDKIPVTINLEEPTKVKTEVSRMAMKTTQTIERQTIEEVLAKRFNSQSFEDEFLIKWALLPEDHHHTWELRSNLSGCKHLLTIFEIQLAGKMLRHAEKEARKAKELAARAKAGLKKLQQNQTFIDAGNVPREVSTSTETFEMQPVKRILAKRFNPRRRVHEYLIIWEGFPQDQSTWEPLTHLNTCKHLLETFEMQLALQKLRRAEAEAANGCQ